jgi:hypothetical protein
LVTDFSFLVFFLSLPCEALWLFCLPFNLTIHH